MGCPGALVGVFPDEGEPERYALGVADVQSKRPMTLDMHMRVGSVLKPLLGTVVLQLCDEGKLALDDPVSKHVEGVPNGDRITLRMLGANTSGLFNTIENKAFQRAIMAAPGKEWTVEEVLAATYSHDSYFAPGESWRYSNTNAVLLALCIERVTGEPWAAQLSRRVLNPLGMEQTSVPKGPELPDPHPSSYRNGYPDKVIGYGDVFYDVSQYSASWTGAAGNLVSTLDDLGRAIKPIATGVLISEASRREQRRWVDTGYDGARYGFCLYEKEGSLGHPGDVPGFNAWFVYYPDHEVGVVVLTNLSNNADDTMPASELAEVVLDGFDGD